MVARFFRECRNVKFKSIFGQKRVQFRQKNQRRTFRNRTQSQTCHCPIKNKPNIKELFLKISVKVIISQEIINPHLRTTPS